MSVLLLILGLVLFVMLVIVHEYGHYKVARRHDVAVEEFGIGFPPKAKSLGKKHGTEYTLNWLPLGGFVRLKGEHDIDKEPHSYGAAPLGVKVKILLAGVGMNLLAAFVILTALGWLGTPVLVCNQYSIKNDTHTIFDTRQTTADEVESDSPASHAGIKAGDTLLAAGPDAQHLQRILPDCSLSDITKKYAGSTLVVQYVHKGQTRLSSVKLRSAAEVAASQLMAYPKGYLGVVQGGSGQAMVRSTWSAPIMAGGIIMQFTALTFHGLGAALHGLGALIAGFVTANTHARQAGQTQASGQVTGPVGIFVILKASSALGYRFILMLIAIISLTLAIMNVLPIPALDGGKLFVTLLFRAIKKPLTVEVENWVYGSGFAVLMALIIVITIVDVKRFF